MDEQKLEKLQTWVKESSRIVFFGGAGVSTESGIPDFRGAGGLYLGEEDDGVPPEEKLHIRYFLRNPEGFYRYYRRHMLYPEARPNAAHLALAALERAGKLSTVITQNIDGLHQKAGSKHVLELHGSIHRNYCMRCAKFYDAEYMLKSREPVPRCTCGGVIKPDVVLYEEGLDQKTLSDAVRFISEADMLIIGGTSLNVYPAAGLINYYRGHKLVLINKCRIDEAILAQCPNLKWVGIIATGTDNIDLEACRRHGVAVANVPGYSTYSVAQMTFSLLLAICQCAQRYDRAVKAGYWQLGIPAEYGLLPQVELLGKTFGIYGYGSIGRQTARIARAFGMEVLVCTRTVRPEYAADGVEFVDFDTLLARSDVLSLHCPATPETRGLVSREALAKMKPGAILLNTARGALVDEEAVADALESGKLAFYGADAFATEPLPPQSRLRSLPGAVLTPHIAWTTKEALQRLMDITTGNLRSFLAGKGENIVNP